MEQTAPSQSLKVSMELSNKEWLLTFSPGGELRRRKAVPVADLKAVHNETELSKKKFKLPPEAKATFCYEAGRDGFWIARGLREMNYEVLVIDSASIEVNRRARRAKSDKIDGGKLLSLLIRHLGGEKKVLRIVNIPSVEQEDLRRIHRERDALKGERTRHSNRIGSLLALHGVRAKIGADFEVTVDRIRTWNGTQLPPHVREEMKREYRRMQLVQEQMRSLEGKRREVLKQVQARQKAKPKTGGPEVPEISAVEYQQAAQVLALIQLCGVGEVSAWMLVAEYFGWRKFTNRRQVGGIAGLGGTPYSSGGSEREQGISKAGRPEMRGLLIELAWSWLRYQPNSKISRWFKNRCAKGDKRTRRRAIVAVARQLAVALWRYTDQGVIPEGAELKKCVLGGKVA